MRLLLALALLVAACGGGGMEAPQQGTPDGGGGGASGGGGDTPDPDVADEGTVLRVTLSTGDRRVVSDNNTGSGPAFRSSFALALDGVRRRLVVLDEFPARARVFGVDVADASRAVLSDDDTGDGPAMGDPISIAVDAANDRALVLDRDLESLVAVDLATGDRTVVSDDTNAGPRLSPGLSLAFDPAGNRAFAGLGGSGGIVAVDLATGDRAALSDSATGTGPGLSNVLSLAFDGARGRLLAVQRDVTAIIAIDLSTGDRAEVAGAGPLLVRPRAVAVDRGDRAVILGRDALWVLDLTSGDRALVSDDSVGSGPRFDAPWGVVFDDVDPDVAFVIETNAGGP